MAHIKWGQKARPMAVNFILEAGLQPGAVLRLTADTGAHADLMLDNAELMRLVSGIQSDPRFTIEKRAPKRDKDLDGMVDSIMSKIMGQPI